MMVSVFLVRCSASCRAYLPVSFYRQCSCSLRSRRRLYVLLLSAANVVTRAPLGLSRSCALASYSDVYFSTYVMRLL